MQCWTLWKGNVRIPSPNTNTRMRTAPPCFLPAVSAAQCSGNSRLLFQVPSEILSLSLCSLFFGLPQQSAGGEWSCVSSFERGFLFSLKPQALFGSWLGSCECVCACIVHNGCVYIGFGVHVFIHACTFICTCRLCFLLSRERSAWCLSIGKPDTYWFYKVVAGCLMQNVHLECFIGFVGSLVLLRVNVYFLFSSPFILLFCVSCYNLHSVSLKIDAYIPNFSFSFLCCVLPSRAGCWWRRRVSFPAEGTR